MKQKKKEVLKNFNEQYRSVLEPRKYDRDELFAWISDHKYHNLVIIEKTEDGEEIRHGYNDYSIEKDFDCIEKNPVAMEILEKLYYCRILLKEKFRYCVYNAFSVVALLIILEDKPKFHCNYLILLSDMKLDDFDVSSEEFESKWKEEFEEAEKVNEFSGVLKSLADSIQHSIDSSAE